ncbi:hypothetical protein [Nocardia sp. NRRL S-836]|uniref:hypothetical protein n=1 Tax=Nocardia sp. NRRL S-836 TaxID=1519492 RepID=UPI0006B045D0|nr:hypothetical protein [Nocardia sp. NRRL S-836]KOV84717.1 hypothetical protein ADL03_15720 [Nocardia sp. NRRL S-836]
MLDADGLVVRPVSGSGEALGCGTSGTAQGPWKFLQALATAFAEQGRGWDSAETYRTNGRTLRLLFNVATASEPPVTSVAEITITWWTRWAGDVHTRRVLSAIIRRAPGLPEATWVFLERPRRRPLARRGTRRKRAHTWEELKVIRDAAAATVRAGRRRIAANTAVLQQWCAS